MEVHLAMSYFAAYISSFILELGLLAFYNRTGDV